MPEPILQIRNLSVSYKRSPILQDINLAIYEREILGLIGASGSGKSTLLRCCNRLNDVIAGMKVRGEVIYKGQNIYAPHIDPVKVRQQIGMVFQRPNPFPKSIYENIAFGLRVNGYKTNLDQQVEQALRQANLWEEVKDKLNESSKILSGGQQQRLCIARAIALKPQIILMDEPCSALDPISTAKIEELLLELKQTYTIVIVTHNLQQAKRITDRVAFINVEINDRGERVGRLVECNTTAEIFSNPREVSTLNYVQGRMG
ncbi:MAG: phosphate ABC transporter ATP-binding protein PstB [Pseudanabaenaceae cyanobacterium]